MGNQRERDHCTTWNYRLSAVLKQKHAHYDQDFCDTMSQLKQGSVCVNLNAKKKKNFQESLQCVYTFTDKYPVLKVTPKHRLTSFKPLLSFTLTSDVVSQENSQTENP